MFETGGILEDDARMEDAGPTVYHAC